MVSRDPRTIVHEILGTSVDLPNPNHAKLRHPTTKSVRDICCRKLVLPKKWTKMYQNRRKPATHNVRHYANFIVLGQTIYEKIVTKFFIPLNILGPPEPQFTNLRRGVQQGPLYKPSKFRHVLKTRVRDTCCQKFVDFGDSVTDTQTNKKQTVNNIVSVLPCGDRKRRNTSGRQKVNRHSSSVS